MNTNYRIQTWRSTIPVTSILWSSHYLEMDMWMGMLVSRATSHKTITRDYSWDYDDQLSWQYNVYIVVAAHKRAYSSHKLFFCYEEQTTVTIAYASYVPWPSPWIENVLLVVVYRIELLVCLSARVLYVISVMCLCHFLIACLYVFHIVQFKMNDKLYRSYSVSE